MIYMLVQLIICTLSLFVLDLSTIIFAIFVYLFGVFCIFIASTNKDALNFVTYLKIYQIIYMCGFIYIVFCYLYMVSNGYSYLLAWDIENYFLPRVRELLDYGGILKAQSVNWENFNVFSRYQSGYFAYLIPFAYLSNYLSANLYVLMQFSTLLIASFSGPLIYRLLCVNNIESRKSYKYTLIICLFSIIFFYSTQLLRDIQVMFLYLLGIYLTFNKDFLFANLFKIFLVIFASCTLRIETGLFLFILVPIYLISSVQKSRKKNIAILFSGVVSVILLVIVFLNFNEISNILDNNSEVYFESDKGDGLIGNLQKIPVIGSLLAIFYNAIQPLPFWGYFDAPIQDNRPQMYNIMTFPLFFSSLFNWFALFTIFIFVVSEKTRNLIKGKLDRTLVYHIILGFIFLYIQASVIDQRRLMAYYVIFYILAFIIFTYVSKRDKQMLILMSVSIYSIMQILAFLLKY